jgi:hypothetical protein
VLPLSRLEHRLQQRSGPFGKSSPCSEADTCCCLLLVIRCCRFLSASASSGTAHHAPLLRYASHTLLQHAFAVRELSVSGAVLVCLRAPETARAAVLARRLWCSVVHAFAVQQTQPPAAATSLLRTTAQKRDSARHPEYVQLRPECLVHNASLCIPRTSLSELERQDGSVLDLGKQLTFATPPTTCQTGCAPNSERRMLSMHNSNQRGGSSSRSLSVHPQS